MKAIIFSMFFLAVIPFRLPAMLDTTYYPIIIRGVVFDTTNSTPAASQQVFFICNTPNTYPAVDTTRTNFNGHFTFDTIYTMSNFNINIDVYTYDCNGNKISQFLFQYQPYINLYYAICGTEMNQCEADFGWEANPMDPLTVQFYDLSTGNINFRYWEFGDGSTSFDQLPLHAYDSPGVYTVIYQVMDTSTLPPCISIDTQYVQVNDCQYYNLGGQVFNGSFPYCKGRVDLYLKTDDSYILADTCRLNHNGVYYFFHMPEGQYLVKVVPDDNGSPSFFLWPTYYGNALHWTGASHVNLVQDFFNAHVHMIPIFSYFIGPGMISGILSSQVQGNLEPCYDGQIILSSGNGLYIDYTFSGDEGSFQFYNLPYGTYNLRVEIPGTPPDMATVTLSAASPVASDLQLVVNGPAIGMDEYDPAEACLIYPNPAGDFTRIYYPADKSADLIISIYDLPGKQVYTQTFSVNPVDPWYQLSLAGLENGTYLVTVRGRNIPAISRKLQVCR